MSAVMSVCGKSVMVVSVLVILESSCDCDSWVVSLGGMYMFAMCKCFDVERWILMSCSSIGEVWGVSSCEKVMLFLT